MTQIREPHDVVKPSVGTTVKGGPEDLPPSSCLWCWQASVPCRIATLGLSPRLLESPGNLATGFSQEEEGKAGKQMF